MARSPESDTAAADPKRPALPWYKWFCAKWLSSERRFTLTLAERGAYRDLLDLHYAEGSIPKNPWVLSGFLGVSLEEFNSVWPKVSQCFEPHPDNPDRLVNTHAIDLLSEQCKLQKRQSSNGSKGGRPRKQREAESENPWVSSGFSKKNPKEAEEEVEERKPPPTPPIQFPGNVASDPIPIEPEAPPDWAPWGDGAEALAAILRTYPNGGMNASGARVQWQMLVTSQPDPPGLARRIHAAAALIGERCPPEKLGFLPNAGEFLRGRWEDDWSLICERWSAQVKRDRLKSQQMTGEREYDLRPRKAGVY